MPRTLNKLENEQTKLNMTESYSKRKDTITQNKHKTRSGLIDLYTTSGLETDRAYRRIHRSPEPAGTSGVQTGGRESRDDSVNSRLLDIYAV